MKLVCQKCEIEFIIEENGVVVAEMFLKNKKIYKLWMADLWKCPKCGCKIVAGFALNPFAREIEKNCELLVKKLKKQGKTIIYDYET